jgi:aminoglycoside/choline kinase family phosphotransferase
LSTIQSIKNPLLKIQRAEFLRSSGWAGGIEIPVGEDWSQRSFFRIEKKVATSILIQSAPDGDPRQSAGHKLCDFVKVSEFLNRIGLSAPKIIAQDFTHGLLLVEDFGSSDFATLIKNNNGQEKDLYLIATETLKHIYQETEYVPIDLPNFSSSHIYKGHQRIVDWYMPAVKQEKNDDFVLKDYLNVWSKIEKKLPPPKIRMLHGDFHPGNIMWLPERQRVMQAGLIDFQGAMVGPAAYDLVNLLDDARRIVPNDVREECLSIYLDGMTSEEKENFLSWYAVLAAQFHCRVIGQALRLAICDGKTRLLDVIPILRSHLLRDLSNPSLKPLKDWFDSMNINFHEKSQIDIDNVKTFIRSDAF